MMDAGPLQSQALIKTVIAPAIFFISGITLKSDVCEAAAPACFPSRNAGVSPVAAERAAASIHPGHALHQQGRLIGAGVLLRVHAGAGWGDGVCAARRSRDGRVLPAGVRTPRASATSPISMQIHDYELSACRGVDERVVCGPVWGLGGCGAAGHHDRPRACRACVALAGAGSGDRPIHHPLMRVTACSWAPPCRCRSPTWSSVCPPPPSCQCCWARHAPGCIAQS